MIQELTVSNLRTMLLKQQKHFEQLTTDYTKGPSDKLEQEVSFIQSVVSSC